MCCSSSTWAHGDSTACGSVSVTHRVVKLVTLGATAYVRGLFAHNLAAFPGCVQFPLAGFHLPAAAMVRQTLARSDMSLCLLLLMSTPTCAPLNSPLDPAGIIFLESAEQASSSEQVAWECAQQPALTMMAHSGCVP